MPPPLPPPRLRLARLLAVAPRELAFVASIFAHLGPSWRLLALLGPILAQFGAILGLSWAILGPSWPILAQSWVILELSWGIWGPSWAILGPLGPTFGNFDVKINPPTPPKHRCFIGFSLFF